MSQEDVFNRMKPSTDYKKRMRGIEWIKESGMRLASGNIVDYPGQTDEQIAEDILLMKQLEISWAPVIPSFRLRALR
jgi:biotin synthase